MTIDRAMRFPFTRFICYVAILFVALGVDFYLLITKNFCQKTKHNNLHIWYAESSNIYEYVQRLPA